MSKTTLIKATGLTRYYGDSLAVNNLSFELKNGDILGFLGPNGAGKSTSMQMLSGCLAPDAGEIEICGINLVERPTLAKQFLGYLPEQPPLYKELTVDEYLIYCAQLRAVEKPKCKTYADNAKQRCGLGTMGKKLIANLSKGYQQRVGIAQAIIHNPAVVILDEPTVGLDPIQIQEIRQLILELSNEHGIILSTHILPEVQAVCNRVQIMQKGELVFHSDMQSLNKNTQSSESIFSFKDDVDTEKLANIDGIKSIEVLKPGNYCINFVDNSKQAEQATRDLLGLISLQKWSLLSMTPKTQSLEQIFIDLTVQPTTAHSHDIDILL